MWINYCSVTEIIDDTFVSIFLILRYKCSKIVFLLGYSSTIQTIVDKENERFHDIVQEDFIDAYKNNTLKTIMAFNWAVLACPGTKYLLFIDNDYFVNVNAITEYLKENATSNLPELCHETFHFPYQLLFVLLKNIPREKLFLLS
jgi:hypothetical protein